MGEEKGMGWKWIILEYSSLLLFGSFNGGNESPLHSLGILVGENGVGRRILILLYSFKTSNFSFPPKLGKLEGIKLNLMNFFTKTPKILLYI